MRRPVGQTAMGHRSWDTSVRRTSRPPLCLQLLGALGLCLQEQLSSAPEPQATNESHVPPVPAPS